MIPMGTVVTVVMLVGLIAGLVTLVWPRSAGWLTRSAGCIVVLAGAWNVFWYWLRHPTQYWGLAALVSGLLMLFVGGYLVSTLQSRRWVKRLLPVVLVLLLVAFLHYAYTIYHL